MYPHLKSENLPKIADKCTQNYVDYTFFNPKKFSYMVIKFLWSLKKFEIAILFPPMRDLKKKYSRRKRWFRTQDLTHLKRAISEQ